MGLKILALLAVLISITASESSNPQLKVPESFAFITVTHTRGNDYKIIQKHIHHYATLDCPIATDLNIVWNNQIEPEKAPIKLDKTAWKRPVNFLKTSSNSMDWRYKIPPESKAQVYFIVDDDVVVDCDELKRGFKVWQDNAIGSVGPIVTYAVRFFEYTQPTGFTYGRTKEEKMFALGLVGLSFMSRHFMELYYAKLELLEEMRKVVQSKNNCDDIGINWLVQYFYPELETVYLRAVRGDLLKGGPAIGQSTSATHYPYRNQCILDFTNLFGVNALRYKPINDTGKKEIRIKPLKEATVFAKWQYLSAIIKGETPPEPNLLNARRGQEEHPTVVSDLEAKLLDAKMATEKLQAQCKQLEQKLKAINESKPSQGAKSQRVSDVSKVFHKIPLTQILSVSVVVLMIIIACLIYKLVGLTHENKFLHLRSNNSNAVQVSFSDEGE